MEWISQIATAGLPWPLAGFLLLLVIVLTKGVKGWREIKTTTMQGKQQEHVMQAELIERLTIRLDKVETKLEEEQQKHLECVRKMSALEGKVDQFASDMDQVIRRHDDATRQQIAKNLEMIEQLKKEAAMKDQTISELTNKIQEKADK